MKDFLKSIFIYTAFILGFLLAMDVLLHAFLSSKLNFRLKEDAKMIVVGNSHPQVAINDTLIPEMVNISSQGESYFYTYQKLKEVLRQNSNISTVFIELTTSGEPHNCNAWMWDHQHIKNKYTSFIPVMDWHDKWVLAKVNPEAFLMSYSISVKSQLEMVVRRDFDFRNNLGGFYYSNDCRIDSLKHSKAINDTAVYESNEEYSYNFQYLKKCIELCKSLNKKIVLIRCPLHQESIYYNEPDTLHADLRAILKTNVFLDFSKFPLEDDDFADFDHLNHLGAAKFSNWFQGLIAKGLLDQKNMGSFAKKEFQQYKLNYRDQISEVVLN